VRRGASALVIAAVLATAGCGGAERKAEPAPLLSAAALPGLHPTTRSLDARALAQSTPLPGLLGRLDAWGFVRAGEREFSGRSRGLNHVVARTVDFSAAAGAAAYARKVVNGTDAYIGPGATVSRQRIGGRAGWLIRAAPCGCHPQPPTLILVGQRASRVSWLSVSGPAATAARARTLFARLP
jgi:hypothetical protein